MSTRMTRRSFLKLAGAGAALLAYAFGIRGVGVLATVGLSAYNLSGLGLLTGRALRQRGGGPEAPLDSRLRRRLSGGGIHHPDVEFSAGPVAQGHLRRSLPSRRCRRRSARDGSARRSSECSSTGASTP